MTSFLARIYAFKFFESFILIFPLYTVMFVDAGLNPVQISISLTAWSVTTFLLQVPSGVIADHWSRRHILALAQLALGAGLLVWLASPHFWGFFIGLILWGLKSAFTSGTFEALLYDELKARGEEGQYTRVFGRTRAVDSAAVLLAALGAAVMARFGYPAILAASLISIGLAVATALSLPRAPAAIPAGDHDYVRHLREGLDLSLRQPIVLSILIFAAIALTLGGAGAGGIPGRSSGAKVGLTRPIIAIVVGGQNAIEAGAGLIAYRLAGLPTRGFYALFAVCGLMLLAAAGIFTAPAMLLLVLYSGLMKLVAVVFEGRLQHVIGSGQRATIGSVKSFLAQIGITALYMGFGPLAQSTSYRIAFMACGAVGAALGAGYLAWPRRATHS